MYGVCLRCPYEASLPSFCSTDSFRSAALKAKKRIVMNLSDRNVSQTSQGQKHQTHKQMFEIFLSDVSVLKTNSKFITLMWHKNSPHVEMWVKQHFNRPVDCFCSQADLGHDGGLRRTWDFTLHHKYRRLCNMCLMMLNKRVICGFFTGWRIVGSAVLQLSMALFCVPLLTDCSETVFEGKNELLYDENHWYFELLCNTEVAARGWGRL